MEMIRVGLVDDQQLFRQSMAVLIGNEPDFSLLMEAENGASCLEQLATMEVKPDVLLMDMEMPGMDGIELNTQLHQQFPAIRVIVLTVHAGERLIARMIQSGVAGYVAKNCDKSELLMAIRTVFSTGFYINNQVLKAIQASANRRQPVKLQTSIPVELTEREKEILALICQEYNAAEIAAKLFLSVRTVEGHRNNLLQKTGCRNTAGLVIFAVKFKLYEVPF